MVPEKVYKELLENPAIMDYVCNNIAVFILTDNQGNQYLLKRSTKNGDVKYYPEYNFAKELGNFYMSEIIPISIQWTNDWDQTMERHCKVGTCPLTKKPCFKVYEDNSEIILESNIINSWFNVSSQQEANTLAIRIYREEKLGI